MSRYICQRNLIVDIANFIIYFFFFIFPFFLLLHFLHFFIRLFYYLRLHHHGHLNLFLFFHLFFLWLFFLLFFFLFFLPLHLHLLFFPLHLLIYRRLPGLRYLLTHPNHNRIQIRNRRGSRQQNPKPSFHCRTSLHHLRHLPSRCRTAVEGRRSTGRRRRCPGRRSFQPRRFDFVRGIPMVIIVNVAADIKTVIAFFINDDAALQVIEIVYKVVVSRRRIARR
mmetsp:Transcript_15455/g.27546  ORF Transcript_15455/g.27546 Transcript_15455/m.27546 type:complete len:223 (-) Transcript_15455:115-783(-)